MNIAICIRGIHYRDIPEHKVDFRNYYQNYFDNIIIPLKKIGFNVHLFGFTYESDQLEELQLTYNFAKLSIIDYKLSDNKFEYINSSCNRQLLFHLNTIKTIEEYEKEHAIQFHYVINTRFDLYFKTNILTHNIHMLKFNIAFKHLSGNCDDNYWIYPRFLQNKFKQACETMLKNNSSTHTMNSNIPSENINYMHTTSELEKTDEERYKYFRFGREKRF